MALRPKQFIAPVIIFLGAILLLALYLPDLRPGGSKVTTSSGTAAIGGAFTLVDQKNQPFSSDALKGKYSLIYFGFTHCPDICPLTLASMTQALNMDGPITEDVIPVFITIDPERDTVPVMADYVANFHPRFVALTGTVDQVRTAADAYRVFFKKANEDAAGEYTMDHSGFVYLMDRTGTYMTHFRKDVTAEQMATRLRQEIGQNK